MKSTNNVILDIIIALTNGIKNGGQINVDGLTLSGSNYLLGQVIRQYRLPKDYFFCSEKAMVLWKSLTSCDIMNFSFQDRVPCDKANKVIVKEYKGNSKTYTEREITLGQVISYRAVFHDEHIVPVNIIIEQLCKIETITYDSVKAVLDKIRICKMLKEEDKVIVNRSKRPLDYIDSIRQNYTPRGIVAINLVTKERI